MTVCVCWVLVLALVLVCVGVAQAEVRLPRVFSDHMVLQRERPVPVWGWAAPGEKVEVSLGAHRASTAADAEGEWRVDLPALEAGGPHVLKVVGSNTVTISDVLVGEVWLASGQSNMEMYVRDAQNAKQELANAVHPQLRFFTTPRTPAFTPQSDCGGEWAVCSPQTAGEFSAAAYYFAREVQRREKVPVGILHSSWGGTRVQVWMDRETLAADPELRRYVEELDETVREHTKRVLAVAPQVAAWAAQAATAKAAGRPVPMPPVVPDDPRVHYGEWPETPTCLYDSKIAPLVPYALRGALWYQGESNAWEASRYTKLLTAMVQGWRREWGQGDFPFLIVQLANFGAAPGPAGPGASDWAELREAQAAMLRVPNTGLAVAIDLGDAYDIHPKNKQEVGRRLALAAGHLVYGWKDEYSGPRYRSMEVEGSTIRVHFDHATGLHPAGSDRLQGFAIAGADHRFLWAEAVIDGESVVVSNPEVPHPEAVRYAWGENPPNNLYNAAGLPAGPFRTDRWPRE